MHCFEAHEAAIPAAAVLAAILGALGIFDRRSRVSEGSHSCDGNSDKERRIELGHGSRPDQR
jgi:hypothetical protein